MIIQSPESSVYKLIEAEKRIGSYLLILLVYKNGIVFGTKFNERQNERCQWLLEINSAVMVAGIGDLHDFETCTLAISDFCQNIKNILEKHYITGAGLEKFLSRTLHESFSEGANAMAVNFLVADWLKEGDPSLWFINFNGEVKKLKNFVVAGGSEYEEELSEEEIKKLEPKQKKFLEEQKKFIETQNSNLKKIGIPLDSALPFLIQNPRKKAIAYLEKYWKPNMKKQEAIKLIKNVIFGFDPESKDKMIEVVVIEKNKKDIEVIRLQKK